MKNYLLLAAIIFPLSVFSQVGINTNNPQGTFHVDGAKNNPSSGAPSVAQQADDVVVTSAGYVGIGTISPITKIDTRTNPGSTTPGNGPIGIGETTLAPAAAGPGAIRYSTASGGVLQYSNGTAWNTIDAQPQKSIVTGYFTNGQTLAVGGNSLTTVEQSDANGDFALDIFTAPRNGVYLISANLVTTTAKSWGAGEELSINIGGVFSPYFSQVARTGHGGPSLSAAIPLNAGQQIRFNYFLGGPNSAVVHLSGFNRFSITEL